VQRSCTLPPWMGPEGKISSGGQAVIDIADSPLRLK
jgi:hypothetical protein